MTDDTKEPASVSAHEPDCALHVDPERGECDCRPEPSEDALMRAARAIPSYAVGRDMRHVALEIDAAVQAERERADKAEAALKRLERGIVANAGRHSREGKLVRWGHVSEAVGVGSTNATEMCRRAGFDPCEHVGTDPEAGD